MALMQVGFEPMPSACRAAIGIINTSMEMCAFVLLEFSLLFFGVCHRTCVSA